MTSLVEQAKQVKVREFCRPISKELTDLAIAWAQDELKLTQVNKVLFPERENIDGRTYAGLALALREAIRKGILKRVD